MGACQGVGSACPKTLVYGWEQQRYNQLWNVQTWSCGNHCELVACCAAVECRLPGSLHVRCYLLHVAPCVYRDLDEVEWP